MKMARAGKNGEKAACELPERGALAPPLPNSGWVPKKAMVPLDPCRAEETMRGHSVSACRIQPKVPRYNPTDDVICTTNPIAMADARPTQ